VIAEQLATSRRTIYRWIETGQLDRGIEPGALLKAFVRKVRPPTGGRAGDRATSHTPPKRGACLNRLSL
jgi:hypothetical protein